MSALKRFVHFFTSHFPAGLRELLICWYNRHAVHFFYDTTGLKDLLPEILFHKYTSKQAYRQRVRQLHKIRQKEVINVIFQIWNLSKWKCDSVYKAMEKHPRFRPVIWILDEHGASADEKLVMRNKIITACQEHGYTYTQAADWSELDSEVSPDIIFIQDFYVQSTNMNDATKNRLFCSVRYCFANTNMKRSVNFFMLHISLFLFLENESVARESRPHVIHHGHNFSVTGHPIVDALMERPSTETSVWKKQSHSKKKIIWAPHWTINDDGPAFNSATFLQYAEPMRTLAQKNADKLQIAFKPHPTLYRVLCEHPEWGKEKADSYYAWWEKQPNTQLETGEYKALFQQSDAMIHDSGSFILEYLLMDKPCMYLSRAIAFPHFNEMNKEALKCYRIGKNLHDIEDFIQHQVINYADTLQEQRHAFVNNYLRPPHGKTAAENIIETILNSCI